jgi:hypothetical protein
MWRYEHYYSTTGGKIMPKLTSQEIVDLNKEYTFYSWSNQGQVNPIPMVRAEVRTSGMLTESAISISPRSWSTPTWATSTPKW